MVDDERNGQNLSEWAPKKNYQAVCTVAVLQVQASVESTRPVHRTSDWRGPGRHPQSPPAHVHTQGRGGN